MPKTKPRLNPKAVGEAFENLFAWELMRRNLTISKPAGDSARYDSIVDRGRNHPRDGFRRLVLIQIRGTLRLNGRLNKINTRSGRYLHKLSPKDADFLAAYVAPHQIWYIIPVKKFSPACHISLYPHIKNSKGRFEMFRHRWNLLNAP